MRRSIALLLLAITTACAGGDTPAGDTSAAAAPAAAAPAASNDAGSCLPGTWTQSSPSFSPKFVFNADGTGEETQAESQGGKTRAFNWKANGADKVTITFPGSTSSTDWNVNCQNGTFASLYKKQ